MPQQPADFYLNQNPIIMNKKLLGLVLFGTNLLAASSFAQVQNPPVQALPNAQPVETLSPVTHAGQTQTLQLRDGRAICTDKNAFAQEYGGIDQSNDWVQVGGIQGWESMMLSFPAYSGNVTRIDFMAEQTGSNKELQVSIHAIDQMNVPIGSPLASATLTLNGGFNEYGASFSTPVAVTGGFAAVVWSLDPADSCRLFINNGGSWAETSYLSANGNLYNLSSTFNLGSDCQLYPTIEVENPDPTFTTNPTSICDGGNVIFTNTTSGSLPGYLTGNNAWFYTDASNPLVSFWDFGDGSPTDNSASPNHAYNGVSGSVSPSLTHELHLWSTTCPVTTAGSIAIDPVPTSGFSYDATGLSVQFDALSANTTSYSWNFGDGGSSAAPSPVHNYPAAGTYTVELTSTNACGSDLAFYNITIDDSTNSTNVSIEELAINPIQIKAYPNPTSDQVNVSVQMGHPDQMVLELYNELGQEVTRIDGRYTTEAVHTIDVSSLRSGIYLLRVRNADYAVSKAIMVR